MKRIWIVVLVLVVLAGLCGGVAASILFAEEKPYGEFIPVVRFAVASDTHVDDKGTELFEQRLEKMFASAYAYAQSQEYSALDGVFITGDFTNNGTLNSMQKVFWGIEEYLQGDTVCRVTLGNHDFYANKGNTIDTFLEASGYETANTHFTLNGYHFICINPDIAGLNFSEATVQWLDEQIAAAAAEDPSGRKPIFVFQHQPAYDTVVHSIKFGVEELTPVLKKYPQVVNFTGHTHCPTSDPRNIWRGEFTTIGVGSLSHYEFTIASQEDAVAAHTNYEGDHGIWPALMDASQYYIVEVDANHAVRLLRYDVDTDRLLEDPVILTGIGQRNYLNFDFLNKLRSSKPVFAQDAQITAEQITSSAIRIRFPQAQCSDTVHYYSVELYQDGEEIDYEYRLAYSFLDAMPETLSATFTNLQPDTQYTIKVFARNPWGRESEPCTMTFRTESAQEYHGAADVLDLAWEEDGLAFNAVTGEIFSQVGHPMYVMDPELGRKVVTFDGQSGFLMDGFAREYERLTNAVSFEIYLKLKNTISDTQNRWVAPLSNLQSAGAGIEISTLGYPSFQCFVNGDYGIAESKQSVPLDEYFHLVGTYDGEYVRLFLNGEEIAEAHAPGGISYGISGYETADYLGIGMDADPARMAQSCMTGILAVARIYSFALTPEEVQQAYSLCVGNE